MTWPRPYGYLSGRIGSRGAEELTLFSVDGKRLQRFFQQAAVGREKRDAKGGRDCGSKAFDADVLAAADGTHAVPPEEHRHLRVVGVGASVARAARPGAEQDPRFQPNLEVARAPGR